MKPRTERYGSREGSTLVIVLIFSLVVTLTVAAAVVMSTTMGRNSQYQLGQAESLSLAESVTEVVQKDMLTQVANFKTFNLTGDVTVNSVTYPYTITAIGSPVTRVDPDGVSLATQAYEIESVVSAGDGNATVRRVVDLTMTPIFQFMIFYADDLEILPGPDMILEGRVHANGDLYIGSGNTLTVDTDYFKSTGEMLRERKNDGSTTGGTINLKVYGESTYETMGVNDDSANSDWLNISSKWKGSVENGAHGVREVAAPTIGSIKAIDPDTGEKGYYHANADLVIVDGDAYVSGSPVTLPPGTITERTMYDGREGMDVTVTEVDMAALNTSGYFPSNGLVYAYRTDASPSQPNGIRLTNGSELQGNLTVVSEDPVYVHGDYNTVNKKGAAVISDAVNLLSNAWNDSKTAGNLPAATATTYNMAMITGIVPTPDGGGSYSGGFENLPRFHESWSGVPATIRGAFVNIFESEIGTGNWSYGGDVYTAPIRDWRYDSDLLNATFTPPFSPNAVYFRRVLWDDNLTNPLQ